MIPEQKIDTGFLERPYRVRLIGVLFVVCTFNFADRAVFSALAQTIKVDLQLTDLQLGLLQGIVFALLYAVVGLPIGLLAERIARTRIIAVATGIWSLATIATGMANSFIQLAFARLMVGMGEAGFTPPTASMVADVSPRNRRASTMSMILIGTPAGYIIGAPLAGLIAEGFGWQMAFLAFGIPGVLVALALPYLLPEPPRGLADGEVSRMQAPPVRAFLSEVWNNGTLKWVIAGGSLAGFGMTAISQFLAVFLARTHELSVREAATAFGSVSGISLAVGLLTGSMVTDALSRRDPRWPAWGAAIGLVMAVPLYLLAFRMETFWHAVVMLLLAGAMLLLYFGPTAGMIQNLLPSRMRASGSRPLHAALYIDRLRPGASFCRRSQRLFRCTRLYRCGKFCAELPKWSAHSRCKRSTDSRMCCRFSQWPVPCAFARSDGLHHCRSLLPPGHARAAGNSESSEGSDERVIAEQAAIGVRSPFAAAHDHRAIEPVVRPLRRAKIGRELEIGRLSFPWLGPDQIASIFDIDSGSVIRPQNIMCLELDHSVRPDNGIIGSALRYHAARKTRAADRAADCRSVALAPATGHRRKDFSILAEQHFDIENVFQLAVGECHAAAPFAEMKGSSRLLSYGPPVRST